MTIGRGTYRSNFLRVLSIIAFTLFMVIGLSTDYITAAEGEKKVTIIHTNDIHAQIDDFGKLAAYKLTEEKAADIFFYVDAGDIFSGNPVVDMNDGEPIVNLLNQVGLDLIGIGNHEYDYGVDVLNNRIEQADFEFLSANTKVVDSEYTQPKPYKIIEKDGVTFGFIGLTQAPPATAPKNIVGIEFHEYKETIKEFEYLRDKVDVLIGLNHIGLSEDRKLAEEFPMFDAIIGGHSHTEMKEEEVVNGTTVVQAGSHLNNIGNMTITLDDDNKVETIDWVLQPVDDLTDIDENIQTTIDNYNAEMEEELKEVIGKTTGLPQNGKYAGDVALGNFWTDAMRGLVEGSDIAFTNNGGIRTDIPAGNLTVGHILNVEPFSNMVMEIDMTGKAIRDVLEYSFTRDDRNQIDLQTSGLKYVIHLDESGELKEVEITIEGEPIEDEKVYKAAVPDYIGSGGSGYDFVGDIITNNSGLMTDAMIDHATELMKDNEMIDIKAEGRVQIKKGEPQEKSIAEVKELNNGVNVIVEGVVMADSGVWGAEGFYVHDLTGGIYVFQGDYKLEEGDFVRVTGQKAEHEGEVQISEVSSIQILENDYPLPDVQTVGLNEIDESHVGELVKVEEITINELNEFDSGTFEFLDKNSNDITFRIDSRTGLPITEFAFKDGDTVDVIGIVGLYGDELQVKPRKAEDIVESEEVEEEPTNPGPTDPEEPTEPETPGDDDEEGTEETEDDNGGDKEELTPPGVGNDGSNQGGSELPKTATNSWNMLAIGGSLLIIGSGLLFVLQRKRKVNES